ncbi:MAG: hypothetical protein J7L11_08940 [Thermoprotei archaeon]|nr:hypothetical protein [Thermoprotei archaeon]
MSEERIKPWPENPYYWEYDGKPMLLLGGSDEDNLFNHPDLMAHNLDALVKHGGNYIRCTLSCRDLGNVWPFMKVNGKYDLSKFNPEFWSRLKRCLKEACKRDIIVQIEIWDPHDFWDRGQNRIWSISPWNPAMNLNYTSVDTRLKEHWDQHPSRKPQPFFLSPIHKDEVLLEYQERFVTKVLDETVEFPNVLYCLDNETRAPSEWTLYWAEFMRREAKERGVEIQLTEMWDPWDLTHELHSVTYKHPELFTYTEVSQNNWQRGRTHYERLLWFREIIKKHNGPRPMNNVKIYGAPMPRQPAIPELNLDRFWKCIFAGCASARFHRPPTGIGLSEEAQKAIRASRVFTSSFDIFHCEPRPDLVKNLGCEVYCLARPSEVYALYFPRGGKTELKVEGYSGGLKVRWFNPERATFTAQETLQATKDIVEIRAPSERTWLVIISPLS